MAEFKLGRIRFVWKNQWSPSTVYYQDDVIAFGGKTYICTIGHTSESDFFTDLDVVPSKWNLVSEGQTWKGEWTVSTNYVYGDIVSYGARVYIANTIHTSAATATGSGDGLEADLSKWTPFAEGLDWKGDWVVATRYRINDFVKYGGASYVCNTLHVSTSSLSAGLESDIAYWDILNQGIEYKGSWTPSTRYKLNDLVRYGAGVSICITAHTSGATFDANAGNWTKFVEGFQYENDWSPVRTYQSGDVVRFGGNQYISKTTNTNSKPTVIANDWDLFTEGFRFIGDWNEDSSNTHYKVGEVVRLGGFTYVCTTDHETAQQPPNAGYWKRLNEGFRWRGVWLDDQEYYEGDVVRYGDNSYICTLGHISEGDDYSSEGGPQGGGAEGSRPDLADSGQYWSVLAIGTEQSVLTTEGDLVYYSGSAPTRLPVGLEGQVLKVNASGVPNWAFLQSVEDVYFVAEHGDDLPFPTRGGTLDRPFKTIRYACEQIDKGTKNPNAQKMVELNRSFIQREVTAYIRDQVDTATPGSIWENFVYDTLKCERDVGFVLDRIVYDMAHGGNLKTRAAAQTFLNALDDGPFSKAEENNGTGAYGNLLTEGDQSVAAYNYMLTLIGNVLANETPTTIYQNVTDDSSAIIEQYTNINLRIESGSLARLTSLANIVITAIDTGLVSNIPNREVPQTLVKVAAGTHNEVLPIIVPAYCAILGDELRSTKISAALATTPAKDTYYTVKTFDRVADIVSNIVVGSTVTPTAGNTTSQYKAWPLAITDQSTAVTDLVNVMKYQVDYGLNGMHSAYVNDPITLTTGRENAKINISNNIEFILAEVLAFLAEDYPDLKYGKTDTKRDARYIIDSLIYDLTYGGNSLAVLTGLAYFDGDDDSKPQLPDSIKAATIASLNFLKTTAQSVAANISITSPLQSVITQSISSPGAGSQSEIGSNVEDIIDIINNGPAAVGTTTTLVNPTLTNNVNTTTALIAAKSALDSATATIKTDTTSWIGTNYPNLVYNSAKCERDVGKILEAVGFDFALNSNYRTLKAAHAYLRKTALEVYTGGQKTATRGAIQYALLDPTDGAIANVAGDTTAIARITASAKIIDAVLFSATNEGSVCQIEDQNVYYAMLQLERNRDFIINEVSAWVNYNYVNFNNYYNETTCKRDIGLIVDAVRYDLITGSNLPSSVAGEAYYRGSSSTDILITTQKEQTLEIIKYIRRLAKDYVASTEYVAIYNSFTNVYNILEAGLSAVPAYTFPDNGTTTTDDSTTAGTLQTNRATIISDVTAYMVANHNTEWTAIGAAGRTAWEAKAGEIIDAATFDVAYGGNYQSVIAGDSYYSYSTLQISDAQKTSDLLALAQLKVELVADAEAASQTAVGNNIDDVIDILTNGQGTVAKTYPVSTGESAAIQAAEAALDTNNLNIQSGATGYITTTYSSYTYNSDLCARDVGYYIDALKYDLKYPGNYKSRYVARYYNNSVTGSREEDMFYLRDATGVRNCTLLGLNGDLTPANTFGTSRVTAGAYCSLDPGFGPEDFTTWIISRSPYVQGVTTFGNAATGQKIDGALHNGGNDSIVSNDFTQVISNGIGAHILNNGRAELVSVFTYYSHIGYLAESGGRIRATNGNNSYGTFGSVAEGVDVTETPVTAIVDNTTQYNATISQVNVDQIQLQSLEFGHAGNDYTEATISIFGPGADEVLVVDEFRDGGFNYALVDQDADPDIPIGGSGYVLISNVAQSGSATGIFLAATDGNLSSAYPGMKIYIIGGAGNGQYGVISTYNAGSKEATVVRESDGVAGWDHVVPGTPIVSPNSSSTYQIEPRVTIAAPSNSDTTSTLPTSTTWYDVTYIKTATQYTAVSASGGSGNGLTFDVTRNGSKYYLSINSAGTGYTRLNTVTIAGTDVGGASPANDITVTLIAVNSVTGGVLNFDFDGIAQAGKFLAVGAGTNGALSVDGESWSIETLPSLGAGNWASIASGLQDDGSSTFKPSAVVIIADGANDVGYSVDGDAWNVTNLPGAFNATGENSVAFGQIDNLTARFVVISDADQDIAYSDNGGTTWLVQSTALPATGYGEIAYGAGVFVAINSGTTSAAYSVNGLSWTGVTAPAAFAAVTDIVWGNGKFVALGGTNGIMYSFDGITWYENVLTLPLTVTERKLAYGQGTFVITSDDTDQVQYSHDVVYWQSYTLSTTITGGYNAIAFGNPNRQGKFVILPNASGTGGNAASINTPAKGRASVANEQVFAIRVTEPGSGYTVAPTITITDPNNIDDVVLVSQIGSGVIANPTFVNRGTGFTAASADIDANNSNGQATFVQSGSFIAVRRLTKRPVNGSNVEFASLPGEFYKLVNTISFIGQNDGSYTGFIQVSPQITVTKAPPEGDAVEMRIRFSQVRLTGHDFLDIGTGGVATTNYPNTPLVLPDQLKETVDSDGGRVFYTATDQDGNFRVGDLFTIEQSTGVATLNADAFNIAGLQELSLGEVTLGGNSASVNEFSTDPFFTANSDSVVPTQRAVKAYIESQIGGGGATLNVNSVTAGDIFVGTDTITTLSGSTLNIKANVVFSGTVLGLPLAYNYFLR